MRGLLCRTHGALIASRQTWDEIPMRNARGENIAETVFSPVCKETVMNPVSAALVPALRSHWGDWWASDSGGNDGDNGGYGGGTWS